MRFLHHPVQNRDMEDMAFVVLTKATTITAVLDVMPCSLVQIYPDLGGASAVFCHKDGSTDHVGRFLHYRVSHPTRHYFDMRGCSWMGVTARTLQGGKVGGEKFCVVIFQQLQRSNNVQRGNEGDNWGENLLVRSDKRGRSKKAEYFNLKTIKAKEQFRNLTQIKIWYGNGAQDKYGVILIYSEHVCSWPLHISALLYVQLSGQRAIMLDSSNTRVDTALSIFCCLLMSREAGRVHTNCLPASQDCCLHFKCWKPYAVLHIVALLKMGTMVSETCWVNGLSINHNCCIKLV